VAKEKIMRKLLLAALAGIVATPALAVGRLAEVSIIDRDTGQVLTAHYHRGEYWVAGRPGAHYGIQIHSRDHRRLLAVTSVDGVNVLTGQTAAYQQTGYVFDPWQGYDIAGWRKSSSQIAAFTFTSIPRSYAARTGRPENVGVIGVALFRERARQPQVAPQVAAPRMELESHKLERSTQEAPPEGRAEAGNSADAAAPAEQARRAPAPSLGTGHGRREESHVRHVDFERAGPRPDELIRIRYDSHDNLVAMGVIRVAPPRPRPLDPFPDSPRVGYVPDP
jgi:hypothetical protein